MTPPHGSPHSSSWELQRALRWQAQQVFGGTHHTHWFEGLLTKLRRVGSVQVSRSVFGSSTVAGHAAHVLFCLNVMNDDPDRPPESVDWSLSWGDVQIDDKGWADLLHRLAAEAQRLEMLTGTLETTPLSADRLLLIINQLTHAAYHAGAVAQILKYEAYLNQDAAQAVEEGQHLV